MPTTSPNTIIHGDALARLRELPDACIQCCVTSPPYFGLRSYLPDGHADKPVEIGLEETPDAYIQKLVEVFREVRRVLKDNGTLWVNIGDSYCGGGGFSPNAPTSTSSKSGKYGLQGALKQGGIVSTNFLNCLQSFMEGQSLIFGNAATIRITAKSGKVSLNDNGFPYGVFLSLLGIERVTIKQRDNDFCQVFNILTDESYCWIGCPVVSYLMRDTTDVEIVLDAIDGVSIVISDLDTDIHSILGIGSIGSVRTGKERDSSLTVKEAHEPVAKRIRDIEPIGDAITFDTPLKRLPDIYFVDNLVAGSQCFTRDAKSVSNFVVTEASFKQFTLSTLERSLDLTICCVSHVYVSNQYGSFVRYKELYDKAQRKSNTLRPKQELGIPFMLRQALMEDGWICRSTIIWHKPNCMPESVKDRPTKSHEYLFLLSKSERYYYDAQAILEPLAYPEQLYSSSGKSRDNSREQTAIDTGRHDGFTRPFRNAGSPLGRNKRSVWSIPTKPFSARSLGMDITDHFAVMPEALVEPCILAGSQPGDIVLDPFSGAGTVCLVAAKHGRSYLGIELNAEYIQLANTRLSKALGMWQEEVAV